jgi:hypothetical protein
MAGRAWVSNKPSPASAGSRPVGAGNSAELPIGLLHEVQWLFDGEFRGDALAS